VSTGNGETAPGDPTFEDNLEQLGFELGGESRRGGRMWSLQLNRHVTFVLHDYHDHVVLTWSAALGDLLAERGWVLGTGELSFHDVYPAHDVKLPASIDAVEAELRRVLGTMRIDLTDPQL
jgi:hypothetical protein